MSEDKVIAIVKIETFLSPFEDNAEVIRSKTRMKESGIKLASSIVSQRAGSVVGFINGDLVLEIPDESIDCLKEVHDRLKKELSLKTAIGVGEDSREAAIAAKQACEEFSIKVYEQEMEDKLEDESEELGKAERFVSVEQKTKAAKILGILQQNQQFLDQIKQSSPDIYQGLVAVTQSLVDILKQDRENQAKNVVSVVKKINEHLVKEKAKKDEKMIKEIQKQINKIHEVHDSEQEKIHEEKRRLILEKKAKNREEAALYAKVHDLDKTFLYNLFGKFK